MREREKGKGGNERNRDIEKEIMKRERRESEREKEWKEKVGKRTVPWFQSLFDLRFLYLDCKCPFWEGM